MPFFGFLMSDLKERFADATLQVVHLSKGLSAPGYEFS